MRTQGPWNIRETLEEIFEVYDMFDVVDIEIEPGKWRVVKGKEWVTPFLPEFHDSNRVEKYQEELERKLKLNKKKYWGLFIEEYEHDLLESFFTMIKLMEAK